MRQVWSLFWVFLRLGCTSFGGPVAHIGFFHDEFVQRRRWFSEQQYLDIVALCQFIPGPASSQVGAAIGYYRHGYSGAFAAWLGFTLPSAVIMWMAAVSLISLSDEQFMPWLHGLKLVAVAVVAQAVWSMQLKLCQTGLTRLITIISALFVLLCSGWATHLGVIVMGGLLSFVWQRQHAKHQQSPPVNQYRIPRVSSLCGVLFVALLGILPIVSTYYSNDVITLFDRLYRAGALVFGGGHVVLPLLHAELVLSDLIEQSSFIAGYGLAQTLPGPLFTFATFIGAHTLPEFTLLGASIATVAIFLPGMLILFTVLPLWRVLIQIEAMQQALLGINAAVVGLLLATLIYPIGLSIISSTIDVFIVGIALIALVRFKLPALSVILSTVLISVLIGFW